MADEATPTIEKVKSVVDVFPDVRRKSRLLHNMDQRALKTNSFTQEMTDRHKSQIRVDVHLQVHARIGPDEADILNVTKGSEALHRTALLITDRGVPVAWVDSWIAMHRLTQEQRDAVDAQERLLGDILNVALLPRRMIDWHADAVFPYPANWRYFGQRRAISRTTVVGPTDTLYAGTGEVVAEHVHVLAAFTEWWPAYDPFTA